MSIHALRLAVNRFAQVAKFQPSEPLQVTSGHVAKYLYALMQEGRTFGTDASGRKIAIVDDDDEFDLLSWAQYAPVSLDSVAVKMARVYNRAADLLGLKFPTQGGLPQGGTAPPPKAAWIALAALGFGWWWFTFVGGKRR